MPTTTRPQSNFGDKVDSLAVAYPVFDSAGPDEPDTGRVGWRDAEPWEQVRIAEARMAQRAEAAELLAGLCGGRT